MGNLVADSAGNLYGTASEGGTNKWGVVYELVRPVPPQTVWTEIVLHNFTNGTDGAQPVGGLVFDKSGNLYGTASRGTSSKHGVVFELMPPAVAGGKWKEIVLHTFQPLIDDGATPVGELVWDSAGNLYGVTYTGGAGHEDACINPPARGCGSVFQLSPPPTPGRHGRKRSCIPSTTDRAPTPQAAQSWTLTAIFTVRLPSAEHTGRRSLQASASRSRGWSMDLRVLHPFHPGSGSSEGSRPRGALALHGKGILYGTTAEAGAYAGGMVFQLVPPASAGAAWTENVLYSFGAQTGDGGAPAANLIFGTAGNIFGTTSAGIAGNSGTVFELTSPASSGADWTETVLHSFGEAGDGATPSSGLIIRNGALFGVTQDGGTNGEGTVYGVAK